MEIFPAELKQKFFFLTKYQAIAATDNYLNKTYFKKNNKVYFNLGSIDSNFDTDNYEINEDNRIAYRTPPELTLSKHIFSFSNGRLISSAENNYV